jgi:ferric-dicitrate binding protein FerR (iron transport regulator)
MSNHVPKPELESADAGIEQLLRKVGRRDEPAAQVQAEVRQAVYAEWRTTVAQRTRRKRWMVSGIAAGTAVVALGATLLLRQIAPSSATTLVASIAQVQAGSTSGVVQVRGEDGSWRDVTPGERLPAGASLRTDATTRVALQFENGLSMRVDSGSLVQLAAVDRAVLERGRLYVDAPPSGHAPLTVQTQFGSIAHVGTQYQAQVDGRRLIVSVREGRVSIAGETGEWQLLHTERLVVDVAGTAIRDRVPAHDASWSWAAEAAPPFDIDNRTLASFFDWAARETGRSLNYTSPQARAEAEKLILRGSTGSLNPHQALAAVVATTNFAVTSSDASLDIGLRE